MPHLNEIAVTTNGVQPDFLPFAEESLKASPINSKKLQRLLDGFTRLDGRMRAIIGRDGTYYAGSAGMLEMFDASTCLRLENGHIRTANPHYNSNFEDLLNVSGTNVRTLALPCTKINGHMLIRAGLYCDTVVLLSLQPATETVEPELADLEQVFHLTKTEAYILRDLFLGSTPQRIADEHENSIHTIRAHIRRCYDKLGITCREELWRKLNAYRLA